MDEERISKAMARIDAALARIEQSAAKGARADASAAQLVARHEKLRESVSASLAELDQVIGALEK